jgi:hypothetical protein
MSAFVTDFERGSSLMAKLRKAALNSLYGFRNYILDGAIPASLGAFPILAIYHVVPLEWAQARCACPVGVSATRNRELYCGPATQTRQVRSLSRGPRAAELGPCIP